MGLKLLSLFLFLGAPFALAMCASPSETLESSRDPASTNNDANNEVTSTPGTEVSIPKADVVVVVDRSSEVQTAQVYLDGAQKPAKTFKVSTGRETFDFPTNYTMSPYCSTTPVNAAGQVFRPYRMYEEYKSNTWLNTATATATQKAEGADMPNAIFFKDGAALHAAHNAEDIGRLGNTASGACVRMHPDAIEFVFNSIAQKDKDGKFVTMDPRLDPQDTCSKEASDERCTNPKRWKVKLKEKNGKPLDVQIIVKDSRPEAEQKKIAAMCSQESAWYKTAIKDCKAHKAKQAMSEVQRGQLGADFDIDRYMSSMAAKDRTEIVENCNQFLKAYHKQVRRPYTDKHEPVPEIVAAINFDDPALNAANKPEYLATNIPKPELRPNKVTLKKGETPELEMPRGKNQPVKYTAPVKASTDATVTETAEKKEKPTLMRSLKSVFGRIFGSDSST